MVLVLPRLQNDALNLDELREQHVLHGQVGLGRGIGFFSHDGFDFVEFAQLALDALVPGVGSAVGSVA